MEHTRSVGVDIHKERISIAMAESGRSAAVELVPFDREARAETGLNFRVLKWLSETEVAFKGRTCQGKRPQRGATQVPRFRRLSAKSRPSVPRSGPTTTTGSPRSCPWEDLITPERQGLCPVQIRLRLPGGKE